MGNNHQNSNLRGSMSVQLLVIMVPVLFGMMGFAVDLGRLYLIRGELNQAANAMALAAASQLLGTATSLQNATTAAQLSLDDTNHLANKYNFGSLVVGQTTGNLVSTVNAPAYFATVADANGASGAGSTADGTTARHVQISIASDAPLLFWGVLPVGQSRKTTVAGQALAGISAPVCTACGIEPFAIAARDLTDPINFGFGDPGGVNLYTLSFSCTGAPAPTALLGTQTPTVPYVIINRFDTASATLDETQQLYRGGASGLVSSTNPNPTGSPVPISCVGINDTAETIWATATPTVCRGGVTTSVTGALCGLYSRFDNVNPPGACGTDVTDFADLSLAFLPDTDVLTGQADAYPSYSGNGRRIITVAVVDALAGAPTAAMTVLGFRQFLLAQLPGAGSIRTGEGGPSPMRRGRDGNMVLETALWIPVLVLLISGVIQFGKITYIYYALKKAAYTAARYISVQQNVNFCDPADPAIVAALQLAVTGTTAGTATPLIFGLTTDMFGVTTECVDPNTGVVGSCDISGCGAAVGAQRPDYVVVNIPNGYMVQPRFLFFTPAAIALKPAVAVPFGGTS